MKILKVILHTSNLDETVHFYRDVIGFTLVNKTETNVDFSIGYSTLVFEEVKETNPTYHFAFMIPSNAVSEALAYIESKVPILPFSEDSVIANFKNWNAHAFYFHDNQQNILEIIAHHDIESNDKNAFGISSIISICEIGIVVKDVTEACKDLNQKYNIPYYIKGPNLKNFSAMGEEDGLFIVSASERGWIPTGALAKRHYTHITYEQDGTVKNYITK